MFSVRQKREISDAIQKILQDSWQTELPKVEINFYLNVYDAESWSWYHISNNGAVLSPGINPHNEVQDSDNKKGPIYPGLRNS